MWEGGGGAILFKTIVTVSVADIFRPYRENIVVRRVTNVDASGPNALAATYIHSKVPSSPLPPVPPLIAVVCVTHAALWLSFVVCLHHCAMVWYGVVCRLLSPMRSLFQGLR